MKAILKFNLPEDTYEFNSAVNGAKYRSSLFDLDQTLRSKIKYNENLTHEQMEIYEEIRNLLHEVLEDNGVNNLFDQE